jgi:hypothetical protein
MSIWFVNRNFHENCFICKHEDENVFSSEWKCGRKSPLKDIWRWKWNFIFCIMKIPSSVTLLFEVSELFYIFCIFYL